MKAKILFAVFVMTAALVSCEDHEPRNVKSPVILPLRLEGPDYKRELAFDADNRLTKVINSSIMPDDVVLEATTELYYNDAGTLERVVTDTGYRLQYSWQDGRVVRTDEYVNDVFTQYYTFTYDESGRLHENTTWQDIPEEGGLIPVAKSVYLYNDSDNLTHEFLYFYNTGLGGHELLTAFEYSDYDNHPEAESLFDAYVFNPTAVFRKNNPGKLITKNRHGNTVLVDQYNYVYDSRGYVIRKTTTSIFPGSGSSGSYNTFYYYEER